MVFAFVLSHLLDVMVINSWLLYKRVKEQTQTQVKLEFQIRFGKIAFYVLFSIVEFII